MVFVDDAYTAECLSRWDSEEDFAVLPFLHDEIAGLLDEDPEDNHWLPTKLAEAAIARTTGLKVDMSTQGPVSINVTLAGVAENQAHNTFIVTSEEDLKRTYSPESMDRLSVPKVTPQDSNVALRSLNFPPKRPKGTPLNGFRLDDNDNPIEQALLDQLSVTQVLGHWGVNVQPIVEFINQSWEIDYAGKLVANASFANAADLQAFLASGGKPSPAIYISPNLMSMYRISQSPTVSFTDVGYSHVYVGRSREVCRFIVASLNIFGRQTHSERFHMVPHQLSTFNPKDLSYWQIRAAKSVGSATGRDSVPGMLSYDDFVSCRQTLRSAEMYATLAEAAAFQKAQALRMKGLASYHSRVSVQRNQGIMTSSGWSSVVANKPGEKADPSKVTTILFGLYHNQGDPGLFASISSTCAAMVALCASSFEDDTFPHGWRTLSTQTGLADVIRNLNLARVDGIGDLAEYLKTEKNVSSRVVVSCYLIQRQIALMKPGLAQGIEATRRRVALGSGTVRISGKDVPMRKVGGLLRTYRYTADWLTGMLHMRPFSYLGQYRSLATKTSALSSLYTHSMPRLVKLGRMRAVMGGADAGGVRTRLMIADLRRHWWEYYHEAFMAYERSSYAMTQMAHEDWGIWRAEVAVNSASTKYVQDVRYGLMAEMVYNASAHLAWKWYKVNCPALGESASTELDEEWQAATSGYTDLLASGAKVAFTADPVVSQLKKGSGLSGDMHDLVAKMADALCISPDGTARARAKLSVIVKTAYRSQGLALISTLNEAVANDRRLMGTEEAAQVEKGEERAKETVTNIDLLVASMAHILFEKKPDVQNSRECERMRNRLVCGAEDFRDVDSQLFEYLNTTGMGLTDPEYHDRQQYFDKLYDLLGEVAEGDMDFDGEYLAASVWEFIDRESGEEVTRSSNIMS